MEQLDTEFFVYLYLTLPLSMRPAISFLAPILSDSQYPELVNIQEEVKGKSRDLLNGFFSVTALNHTNNPFDMLIRV